MTAFDQAWDVVKADTGMWDEIYAPLYEQLGGRGSNPLNYDARVLPPLDFMPTDVAMRMLTEHLGGGNELSGNEYDDIFDAIRTRAGDHGHTVENLKESIMDEGFRIPDKTLSSRSQYVIPNFMFDDKGRMEQWEGRHRTLALHELDAPYIPSFGTGTRSAEVGIDAPWKLNPIYHDTDKYLPSQYSAAAYYGPDKGRYPVPPSWIFGREIVPGMGKLIPTHRGEPIPREDMINHIHDTDLDMDRWVTRPEWKVIHDD